MNSASYSGYVEVVRLLLEKGADMAVATRNGRTPLSWAAGEGYEAVVKLLLESGAEPESKDYADRTPFWWSCRHENGPVTLLLNINGVEVDSKDYYNSTALSVAARMGHKDVVAFLSTKSRSLNVEDIFGRTPLWWAGRNGHPEIADFLQKYKENSINIQKDELPTTTISVPTDKDSGYYDFCVLSISDRDIYYFCKICSNRDFWVCEGCFAIKAHCLNKSHVLVKK